MAHEKTTRALLGTALAAMAVSACALALPYTACGLETPPYTPGEDYLIENEDAFRNQSIEHEEAVESEASTGYYLTSAFYLNWISPDSTVYEGEEAYIGCGATGLETLSYEWFLSRDGGETFEPTGLTDNEHVLTGLAPNDPADCPYLYRCIVTNGDRTSQLQADVWVTVVDVPDSPKGVLGELGDNTMSTIALTGVAACSAAILLALMDSRRRKR